MNWTPTLTRLRDSLAYLYPGEIDARRITTEAGLAQARIDFSGASANRWHSMGVPTSGMQRRRYVMSSKTSGKQKQSMHFVFRKHANIGAADAIEKQ